MLRVSTVDVPDGRNIHLLATLLLLNKYWRVLWEELSVTNRHLV